ncbi:hypothetical protein BFJ71_g14018 [Fusarium oxysporum]|nr:hypothetical protein BFJ71_g14018 [Fusarium oxysporum]
MDALYDNHNGSTPDSGEHRPQHFSDKWLRDRVGASERLMQYEGTAPREFTTPQRTSIDLFPCAPPRTESMDKGYWRENLGRFTTFWSSVR